MAKRIVPPKALLVLLETRIHRCLLATVVTVLMGCALSKAMVERCGAAIDCAEQVRASRAVGNAWATDRACLRLGAVALGMPQAEVEKRLGPADLELREPASCTNAVYILHRDLNASIAAHPVAPDRLNISTLRLVYRDDHVAAVEAQGMAARERFGFGSVRLGDSAEAVQRALGQAHVVSGQVWSYQPLLLLFDDDVRMVEAIALSESEDAFACLLPATFQVSCDPATGATRGITLVRPPKKEIRLHGQGDWPGTIMLISHPLR